jgi:hypothetical protein
MADGPVVNVPGRYTHCVDRADYKPLETGAGSVLFKIGAASFGKAFCDYLLGGKLICLARSECAFGHVVGIEPVGFDKPFPDDIDNDFSFNLLLTPHVIEDFSNAAHQKTFTDEENLPAEQRANFLNQKIVADDAMQGRLISDPSKATGDPWPDPLEQAGSLKSTGYAAPPVVYLFGAGPPTQYIPVEDEADRLLAEVKQDANGEKRVPIPVLHCECEGSRPYFVCSAISPLLDIASGKLPGAPGPSASEICHATLGWIPFVGDAICSLIEDLIALALAPIVLILAATAWFQAQLFDDLFTTGPVSGEIAVGDSVIVTGRWVWDAGHSGWNELHAVFTIQKIDIPPELDGASGTDETKAALEDFRRRACHLVTEPPPNFGAPEGDRTPAQIAAMTPEQRALHDRQQERENQWSIHPLIDGCEPGEPPPDIR